MSAVSRMSVVVVLFSLGSWDVASASTVAAMNLQDLVEGADRVFRGTVISASESTLPAAAGRLPVVNYVVRVDETFKGDVPREKGQAFLRFRLLGQPDRASKGAGRTRAPSGLPRLRTGETYLLMTRRPGGLGLSGVVGLGQGMFRVTQGPAGEQAVNEHGNWRLFRGMARDRAARDGPIAYGELAQKLRSLARGGR
jgi:hypothetical protein